jgi:hypothetical protein
MYRAPLKNLPAKTRVVKSHKMWFFVNSHCATAQLIIFWYVLVYVHLHVDNVSPVRERIRQQTPDSKLWGAKRIPDIGIVTKQNYQC